MCARGDSNDRVEGRIFAPFSGFISDLDSGPHELASGIELVYSTGCALADRQAEWLGESDRGCIEREGWGLQLLYEADDKSHLGENEQRAQERLNLASMSLWLTKPVNCGLPLYLIYRSDMDEGIPHTIRRNHTVLRPLVSDSEFCTEDVHTANKVLQAIEIGYPNRCSIQRAIRYLTSGLHSWHAYPRIAMLTTVLESLLTTDYQELAHKVSERYAWLMHADARQRLDSYSMIKKLYRLRSSVVHGAGRGRLSDKELAEQGEKLETAVRQFLKKVLLDDTVVEVFTGSDSSRRKFLDELIFS